ncbi:DUF3662 and FHA domain-containing protein [Staphylococcus chromogenes]|nr:DUF3662 and FHA domain-containing protein [Staphylococcus chromogenes]
MGVMDRFAKLDSAMQRGLDNSLARVFGGRVVPAEIEELLKQEIADNIVRTYEGYVEAPNVLHVQVSEKDFANLTQTHPNLPREFADQMTRHLRNQGWMSAGPTVVTIELSPVLRTGQLKASSATDPQPTADSTYQNEHAAPEKEVAPVIPSQPESAVDKQAREQAETQVEMPAEKREEKHVNLLLQDGSSRTYSVKEGSNIIGRSSEADLRLPDTGVSREHAEITWDGEDAVLVDLQSTNGTTVNDIPVENWMLADGDVISLGHSIIEVRITKS